jgi:hypothetical protein
MEIRSSPVQSMASELNDGEVGGPTARRVAPSSGEAPGPAHEDGKQVRWLGIDGVVEIEVRHGGLPEADSRRCCG